MVFAMSKRREDDRWGPHAHCIVCGNAMPEGSKVCSEACQARFDEEQRKNKRNQKISYIFIGGMGLLIIVMFLIQYLLG
jgi:predicted nucleic acid-binding Zn ribbon protein